MNAEGQVLRIGNPRLNEIDPLLTAEEVAAILGVRPKRVYELGIPSVQLSARSLRYRRDDVVSWIEERRNRS